MVQTLLRLDLCRRAGTKVGKQELLENVLGSLSDHEALELHWTWDAMAPLRRRNWGVWTLLTLRERGRRCVVQMYRQTVTGWNSQGDDELRFRFYIDGRRRVGPPVLREVMHILHRGAQIQPRLDEVVVWLYEPDYDLFRTLDAESYAFRVDVRPETGMIVTVNASGHADELVHAPRTARRD
ncbi:hypothetical protein GCM10025857_07340 [Alicyclobacillus contaminans]|uniref:hypothetical protein n=1 Tax=Alicyclobacillus contaminans TaxID=392016 RepID=UPI0003F737C9|nr:hypothetical protein [Alicyclobacillus contaminans]GMA49377.1 hypothetical protein GCM10025857_07340 [Alicyclobacillus contaminans]